MHARVPVRPEPRSCVASRRCSTRSQSSAPATARARLPTFANPAVTEPPQALRCSAPFLPLYLHACRASERRPVGMLAIRHLASFLANPWGEAVDEPSGATHRHDRQRAPMAPTARAHMEQIQTPAPSRGVPSRRRLPLHACRIDAPVGSSLCAVVCKPTSSRLALRPDCDAIAHRWRDVVLLAGQIACLQVQKRNSAPPRGRSYTRSLRSTLTGPRAGSAKTLPTWCAQLCAPSVCWLDCLGATHSCATECR